MVENHRYVERLGNVVVLPDMADAGAEPTQQWHR